MDSTEIPVEIDVLPSFPKASFRDDSVTQNGAPSRPSLGDLGIRRGKYGADFTDPVLTEFRNQRPELLEQMRAVVAYDFIYQQVDAALGYPKEIIDAGIEGVVRADLVFSSDGSFLKRRSRIAANSRYLRVLVMRALRGALKHRIRGARGLRARCVFNFTVRRGIMGRKGVFGDSLGFSRSGPLSPGTVKLGPVTFGVAAPDEDAKGFLPPIVLTATLDTEEVLDLFKRGSGIDPLEKFRRDPDYGD